MGKKDKKSRYPKPSKSDKNSRLNSGFLNQDNNRNFVWAIRGDTIEASHEYLRFRVKDFFLKIIPKLNQYATMTWSELMQNRKSCHAINEFSNLNQTLFKHVCDMLKNNEDDLGKLFQIDIAGQGGTYRLIGIREKNIFYIMCFDPKHEFWPSHKKHT